MFNCSHLSHFSLDEDVRRAEGCSTPNLRCLAVQQLSEKRGGTNRERRGEDDNNKRIGRVHTAVIQTTSSLLPRACPPSPLFPWFKNPVCTIATLFVSYYYSENRRPERMMLPHTQNIYKKIETESVRSWREVTHTVEQGRGRATASFKTTLGRINHDSYLISCHEISNTHRKKRAHGTELSTWVCVCESSRSPHLQYSYLRDRNRTQKNATTRRKGASRTPRSFSPSPWKLPVPRF